MACQCEARRKGGDGDVLMEGDPLSSFFDKITTMLLFAAQTVMANNEQMNYGHQAIDTQNHREGLSP